MNVITLRDYAKQNNVSYEAVRKQVVRYADELGDHIIRDGRQQFLDEEAVAFLDGKRQKNPVAIIQQDKDERIEALRQEKENLLKKIATIQEELLQEKDKVQSLLEEKNDQIRLLESQTADLSDEIEKKDETIQNQADELKTANLELSEVKEKLQQEKERPITFKEFWQRRKNGKKKKSDLSDKDKE